MYRVYRVLIDDCNVCGHEKCSVFDTLEDLLLDIRVDFNSIISITYITKYTLKEKELPLSYVVNALFS